MDTKPLQDIGLTNSEISVYLALLKLGQTTAGPIVDDAKVTRSKIYDILERLKQKGLVSHIIKDNTKYFSAADPSNIINYLEKKESAIQESKQAIQSILPDLLAQKLEADQSKVAEVFYGVKGLHNAVNVLLEELSPDYSWLAFGAGVGDIEPVLQNLWNRVQVEREKKKVRSQIIFDERSRGKFESQQSSKLVSCRYIDTITPLAVNIYKNHSLLTIQTKQPIAFLINNKDATDSFKSYFELIWALAKE